MPKSKTRPNVKTTASYKTKLVELLSSALLIAQDLEISTGKSTCSGRSVLAAGEENELELIEGDLDKALALINQRLAALAEAQ